jgi:hypothetical protein
MSWLRRHLSYANVISTVALFIALGTGAYAASTLPANSVGTRQLKKNAVTRAKIASNAVTSGDVKDGSLLKVDFAGGQLPAGAQGAQGPQGTPGAKGDPATKLFAAIGADCGSVDRSSGGVSAALGASGRCDVTFPQSVASCVPVVTVRGGSATNHGEFIAHTNADQNLQGSTFGGDSPEKVLVVYEDSAGMDSATNRPPFFIAVFC